MRPHALGWYRTVSAVLAGASNLADLELHISGRLAGTGSRCAGQEARRYGQDPIGLSGAGSLIEPVTF